MRRRRFEACPVMDALLTSLRVRPEAPPPVVSEPVPGPCLDGRINLHPRGFGFATVEGGDAYYLPPDMARSLLPGDRILFRPQPAKKTDAEGLEVQRVLEVQRSGGLFLGEVGRDGEGAFLQADEPCFLRLAVPAAGLPAEAGVVVAVRVPAYCGVPSDATIPVTLDRVLGLREAPGFVQSYALVKHGFAAAMPSSAIREAEAHVATGEVGANVLDLTHVPFVTIDGESTRDFDDALFAEPRGAGWRVAVAIADVSWYVRPGSMLDQWAAQCCTTVYLPGRTTPMLPEALSTGLCSLTPGAERRALVLWLDISAVGEVRQAEVTRAMIRSAARLAYRQVADFMAGGPQRFAGEVEASLQMLTQIYRLLSAARDARGRLDFDEPEPTLVERPDGTWAIDWEARTDAHKLVEEFMLLANRQVAETLVRRYGVSLVRHQPPPEADDWQTLRAWAQARDHELPETPDMKALAALMQAQDDGDAYAAASHRIRTAMQPARYAVKAAEASAGHFSLSFDWYTHFTSPIRRYADLLVHRLLLATESEAPEILSSLEARVARCSDRAYAARLAERGVWDALKQQSFLAEVPTTQILRARIARSTLRGLRVVIHGWQCAAWLPAAALRSAGYRFEDFQWRRPCDDRLAVLQEGYSVPVSWTRVVRERPAYPELQVKLQLAAGTA